MALIRHWICIGCGTSADTILMLREQILTEAKPRVKVRALRISMIRLFLWLIPSLKLGLNTGFILKRISCFSDTFYSSQSNVYFSNFQTNEWIKNIFEIQNLFNDYNNFTSKSMFIPILKTIIKRSESQTTVCIVISLKIDF